jgi:hypothetical protein
MDPKNFIRRNQMELVKKGRGSHIELIERAREREAECANSVSKSLLIGQPPTSPRRFSSKVAQDGPLLLCTGRPRLSQIIQKKINKIKKTIFLKETIFLKVL